MTLVEFYYIGEIVAAIALIASLIYVGRQVRQNTVAIDTTAAQAYVAAQNEIVGLINTSDNLADALYRGANGLSALNGRDLIQFMAFHDQISLSLQSSYLQWREGALDERLWVTFKQAFLDLLAQPGQQEWWGIRRHWFTTEFLDYVEQAVASESAQPMHPGAVGTLNH